MAQRGRPTAEPDAHGVRVGPAGFFHQGDPDLATAEEHRLHGNVEPLGDFPGSTEKRVGSALRLRHLHNAGRAVEVDVQSRPAGHRMRAHDGMRDIYERLERTLRGDARLRP